MQNSEAALLVIEVLVPGVTGQNIKHRLRQGTAGGYGHVVFNVAELAHAGDYSRYRGVRQAEAQGGFG